MAPFASVFYEKMLHRLNLKPLAFWKKIRLFCKIFFFIWLIFALPIIALPFRLDFLGGFVEESFVIYKLLEVKPQYLGLYLIFLLFLLFLIIFCGKIYGLSKYYLAGLFRQNGEWKIKK